LPTPESIIYEYLRRENMGTKRKDEYDRVLKNDPAVASKILVELCRFKDQRIAELKAEILGMMVKRDYGEEER